MSRGRAFVRGVVALVAAVGLAGCGSGSGSASGSAPPGSISGSTSGSASGSAPAGASGPRPRPAHVLVVVMENHGYDSVVADPDAPWVNGLPAAVFTDWHGITHPSQPNYLAMFSGSTQAVTSDHCPLTFSGPNLAGQLQAAGLSFAGYSEGLPATGSTVCKAGRYVRKHNPWVDFPDLPQSTNQPLTALPSDYAALPTVAFVVPDLCHDTHDCSVAEGDAWLRSTLDPYLAWAGKHDSLLVLTYDEDDDTSQNRIPTLFAGPMVTPGRYGSRGDHYTLLRTIEAMYGLPPIGEAANRQPVSGLWR
jgi:acid phosphatase